MNRYPLLSRGLGLLLVLVSFLLAAKAEAGHRRENLVLQFDGLHSHGYSVIELKKEIRAQFPRVNLSKYEIARVSMSAKSKHGRGTAALRVGNAISNDYTITGSPRRFKRSSRWTYNQVDLRQYGERQRGPWKIYLEGNIKVNEVKVTLKRKSSRHGRRDTRPYQY